MSRLSAKERKTKLAKLRHMMIKEFKDELTSLKIILDKMEKLDIIRQQLTEIDEIIDEMEEWTTKNIYILKNLDKNNIEK